MEEGSPRGKHNPRRKAEQRLRAISTRVRVERKDHVRQGPKTQSAEPYEGGKQPEGCCVDTSSGAQGGSLSSCADPSLSGIALYQWLSGLQGGGARSAPQRGAPSSPRKNSFSKPEPGTSVFPTELSVGAHLCQPLKKRKIRSARSKNLSFVCSQTLCYLKA